MAIVYIRGMSKKPQQCFECPLQFFDNDCYLLRKLYGSWEKRFELCEVNCPLEEKRQTNPFDSVVQLLLDFDLGSEWGGDVKELAQYICDLFKEGAYD